MKLPLAWIRLLVCLTSLGVLGCSRPPPEQDEKQKENQAQTLEEILDRLPAKERGPLQSNALAREAVVQLLRKELIDKQLPLRVKLTVGRGQAVRGFMQLTLVGKTIAFPESGNATYEGLEALIHDGSGDERNLVWNVDYGTPGPEVPDLPKHVVLWGKVKSVECKRRPPEVPRQAWYGKDWFLSIELEDIRMD